MQKKLVHFTFFFLLLTALSGIWMRVYLNSDFLQFVPYTHLLHAHSHVAVLGWTFFGVFILFVKLLDSKKVQKQVKWISLLLFVITTSMFIAFLVQGYAMYSIIFSTFHIFIEYWVALFIFFQVKKANHFIKSSRLFLYGAVSMLLISSIGPFSLGALAATGLRESALFDMAIYFYLHFQYNGWLYLILVGMFLIILHRKGITLSENKMKLSFWLYFISLFPGFFLSILWFDFGLIGIILASVGAIGQLTGVIIFIHALYKVRLEMKVLLSSIVNKLLLFVICLLAVKSAMELALLYIPFAQLIYETRSIVIGYLHLTLLGFISIFIISQFQLVGIINDRSKYTIAGYIIFLGGFILNEFVLFSSGLLTWLYDKAIPLHHILLLSASIILMIAIIYLWKAASGHSEMQKNN